MSRIEAVVSDFGGVLTSPLLDSFLAVQASHDIPLEALGRAFAWLQERDGVHPLHELETGRMSEPDFLALLDEALTRELGRPVAIDGFTETFLAGLRPNDELIAFMRDLRGRGYRMAILTNNVQEWERHWRAMLPVDEIFELVVDSGFVGMRKPDPGIYALTLERLGVAAERTLFLDDVEDNVAAARALGLVAVRFQSTEQAIADVEAALAAAG